MDWLKRAAWTSAAIWIVGRIALSALLLHALHTSGSDLISILNMSTILGLILDCIGALAIVLLLALALRTTMRAWKRKPQSK